MANFATPIKVARVEGSAGEAHPEIRRLPEKATQTELKGSPVILDSGNYKVSGAISGSGVLLAGFTNEPFHNLTTADTAEHLSAGTPINQTNATVIPLGAPLSDGKIGVLIANANTIFEGAFGTTDTATLPASSDVGKIYGLTKDSGNSYWYVDKGKTTTGAGAILTVIGIHEQDIINTLAAGDRVLFKVSQANRLFDQ
ncbi:hypothetical protein LCGC14_1606730 [marine sediment metagenome]|uniref:Uncharacterized protein n=1 Tax=marine sediment metagenome TaxID=412755 RepID=A0A0F9I9J1_9ZZZZ